MKKISVLGATGSIGRSTLDLVERAPDRFEIVALTAASSAEALARAALRCRARLAVVADEERLPELRRLLEGSGCRAAGGPQALVEAAGGEADLVMGAIVGCAGLRPVMAAIEAGKTVALANKEALVSAGELMIAAAARHGATILPVDSEHNAIFQCLAGSSRDSVEKVILTASGGPFRNLSLDEMRSVTPTQAIAHPNWAMGPKISVDSATLMNKGLELIEAHHLFQLPSERIEILIHPQSTVHSLVQFVDGSVLAQLGAADMRVPIAYALAWPERMPAAADRLDLLSIGRLEFRAPDLQRFPALAMARRALEAGGAATAVLNAANEAAVAYFLEGRIAFPDIVRLVEEALARDRSAAPTSIDEVLEVDQQARSAVRLLVKETCN